MFSFFLTAAYGKDKRHTAMRAILVQVTSPSLSIAQVAEVGRWIVHGAKNGHNSAGDKEDAA